MCDKLSSDEVPRKFTEWLLAMGCPADKVPTEEKVVEMCRGQYYMVWRSLMEHVEPKDVVKQKRLQVFYDDISKWKRKNAFNKHEKDATIPEELELWHQHKDIKEKVTNAESRMAQAQQNLRQLMDKISTKLSHRSLSRRQLQDAQRRAWLLQQVAEELKTKKQNLEETRSIANSLCLDHEDVDVQSKLDKYMSSLRRPSAQSSSNSMLVSNPVACSSVVSNGDVNDAEDQLSWLMKCRGDVLWQQLYERRAGLVPALSNDALTAARASAAGVTTPQAVLSRTAALHCTLALETMKNRVNVKQTQKKLKAAISELNNSLSGEACELLVLSCERARAGARVTSLRALLDDVSGHRGLFSCEGDAAVDDKRATVRQIAAVDRAIENKKAELSKLITSLSTTEKKIQNVRECLVSIFNGLQKDLPLHVSERYKGHLDLPQESIASIRQFYEEKREQRRNKLQLSMDLDVSDCSFNELSATSNPKFADELKFYLKKFNLEKNRKLVFESGDKIWVFESVQSAVENLHNRWLAADVTNALLCPSVSLSRSLRRLTDQIQTKNELEAISKHLANELVKPSVDRDVSVKTKEDEEMIDKIKKKLNENLISLQKTTKTLNHGQENLAFWSDNQMKKHISGKRLIDGKTYMEYESFYIENLS